MSAPLAGGGQSFTLPANGESAMLTEYAVAGTTLLIINTSAAGLVYVGNHSGVNAASGVPLEPGTSLPWVGGEQVWASVDPSTPVPVSVVITSAVSSWEPSPAAIAAAIAVQLLETGVSVSFVDDVLIAGVNLLGGHALPLPDISKYASLVVQFSIAGPLAHQLTVTQTASGVTTDEDTFTATPLFTGGQSSGPSPVRLAVSGTAAQITNNGSASTVLTVIGSTRPAVNRVDSRQNTADGDVWTAAPGGLVLGQVVQLNPTLLEVQLNGATTLDYRLDTITGGATGDLEMVVNGQTFTLASHTSLVAVGAGGQAIRAAISLPVSSYGLQFRCTTAGSIASIRAAMMPS